MFENLTQFPRMVNSAQWGIWGVILTLLPHSTNYRSQIVVQFIFHSNDGCSECLEPKGCSRKKLECDFWARGQNSEVKNAKKIFCKTYYKMKNQNIRFRQMHFFHFQLSFLKYVLFEPKNANILEVRVQIKKVFCAKKL